MWAGALNASGETPTCPGWKTGEPADLVARQNTWAGVCSAGHSGTLEEVDPLP